MVKLKNNDYEQYRILIPFRNAAGKRKNKYLFSELEKMHPCFSDEFTFDSSVKGLRKEGLEADVLVVSKYKLAEYEGKRRFSGFGFLAENRLYFVNAKLKVFIWSAFICGLTGLLITAGTYLKRVKTNKAFETVNATETITEDTDQEEKRKYFVPAEIVLLDAVAESKGKIRSFEWNLNGNYQTLSASVKGVFPEQLGDAAGGSVVYEEGIPCMSVSYKTHRTMPQFPVESKYSAEFNKALRNALNEYGALLKEEKAPPYHLEFVCSVTKSDAADVNSSDTKKLFERLAQIISNDNRAVTSVTLKQTGRAELHAGLTIDPHVQNDFGFDLKLVSRNLEFFIEDKKKEPAKTILKNQPVQKAEPVQLEKIGEIKRQNNPTVVFYKNREGKMERRVLKDEKK